METKEYLKSRQKILDIELKRLLPKTTVYPQTIRKSMRYSTFAGGKKLRPILCMAACESFGGSYKKALPFACVLEMIHTYSLIHDDLPAIDNDDLRRGMPTNHKIFGEAMAILAGDALLTMAFKISSGKEAVKAIGAGRALRITHEIAHYAGVDGMVGGQVADIESEHKEVPAKRVTFIHMNKTAALITASVRAGAIAAGCREKIIQKLTVFSEKIGLAFQITDDILNVEGDEQIIGKSVGSDAKLGKATYPAVFGLEKSRQIALKLVRDSMDMLDSVKPKTFYLKEIAGLIVARRR